MTLKKKLLLLAGLLGVAVLLGLALRPTPVPTTAVKVMRGPFTEYVEEEGFTDLRHSFAVAAPIGGYLHRVELEEGDRVEEGQVLFRLEPNPVPGLDRRTLEEARARAGAAEARLGRAAAELEARRSEAVYADRDYERHAELYRSRAIPVSELDRRRDLRDRARSAERAATAAVETARYEVEQARVVLEVGQGQRSGDGASEPVAVHAPIGGVVLARHRRDEGPVAAGERILEIGDLARLEVRVDLLSMDAVRVAPGMRVLLTRWGGEQDLEGRVRRVDPAGYERISALGVEEQRVPVRIDLTGDPAAWERLGTGYRVEARFVLWQEDDIIQIPGSSVFRRDDGEAAFVVENGRARIRSIETGRRSGIWTQVLGGLEPSEIVIAHPADRIGDGTRVRPELREYR
ncbi:MAG: HlyD family efflux transporter periplasmic adaptor subunit [Puniceicoccaceae bacterium]|nr:MAG: HlyD family efflux transporter periplasmic adaptor subunit [Puniceicoccaceae bacterium]